MLMMVVFTCACRRQAQTVAAAAAAVAGFNEIDLAFARYKANTDAGNRVFTRPANRPLSKHHREHPSGQGHSIAVS